MQKPWSENSRIRSRIHPRIGWFHGVMTTIITFQLLHHILKITATTGNCSLFFAKDMYRTLLTSQVHTGDQFHNYLLNLNSELWDRRLFDQPPADTPIFGIPWKLSPILAHCEKTQQNLRIYSLQHPSTSQCHPNLYIVGRKTGGRLASIQKISTKTSIPKKKNRQI